MGSVLVLFCAHELMALINRCQLRRTLAEREAKLAETEVAYEREGRAMRGPAGVFDPRWASTSRPQAIVGHFFRFVIVKSDRAKLDETRAELVSWQRYSCIYRLCAV